MIVVARITQSKVVYQYDRKWYDVTCKRSIELRVFVYLISYSRVLGLNIWLTVSRIAISVVTLLQLGS